MNLVRALGLVLLSVLVSVPAGRATAASPGAGGTASGRTLVVVADVMPDATGNARLRASLYELARRRGLEPLIGADVGAMAES
jgi:hypothetical protein